MTEDNSNIKKYDVTLTFTSEILGTASSDKEIHQRFIASKAPDAPSREEEVASVGIEGVVEKTATVFPRNEAGQPILYDYQVKGFFKDACGMLSRAMGTHSSELKAYKKIIDGLVFVHPRQIPFILPEGGKIGSCQRPLRAQTAQGERVALAHSEQLPAGSKISFSVTMFKLKGKDLKLCLQEWLDYGALRGIGQWRNSGKGAFTVAIEESA